MDAKICDRCGKVVAVQDAWRSRLGEGYYFDLCKDCRLWLLHELHAKEEWENAKNGSVH